MIHIDRRQRGNEHLHLVECWVPGVERRDAFGQGHREVDAAADAITDVDLQMMQHVTQIYDRDRESQSQFNEIIR